MSMDPFSLALSEVGFVADWAGRVSPVVFVFKGTLAYLSYTGAGNAGYIQMRNSVYFQIGWKIRYLTNENNLYSSIN